MVADQLEDPDATDVGDTIATEQKLRFLLSKLPPLYAAVLVMKKRDGKSMEEIARELQLSAHTMKKYLCRALSRCRAELGQCSVAE